MSAKRRRRPTLEERLDRISDLRRDPDSLETLEELRKNLNGREALAVARAARVAGDLGKEELVPEMLTAFDRFMEDPVKNDKGCLAKTAIAKALVEMEHSATALFRRGLRHVQMEGSYGGPTDAAIELRANCALGFVNSGHPQAVVELVPLLLDEGLPVRLAAAQGIGASGRVEAEAVLRFKALAGDDEPEVVTECLVGLLRLAPGPSLEFTQRFLRPSASRERVRSGHPPLKEAAILALGESRLEAAVPLLAAEWGKCFDRESRRTVLLALVNLRREPALDFLLSVVAEDEPSAAREAVEALAILRHDEKIRERVEGAVERSESSGELRRHFEREFS